MAMKPTAPAWIPYLLTGYTVKGAYRTLTGGTPFNLGGSFISDDILWRKDVPLKSLYFCVASLSE